MTITLTAAEITEAREWLIDCDCPEELVEAASDLEIQREIARQYDGGVAEFVRIVNA